MSRSEGHRTRRRYYPDECRFEKGKMESEPLFGSGGAARITAGAASSQENQISLVASAQNAKELAASRKRPKTSKRAPPAG